MSVGAGILRRMGSSSWYYVTPYSGDAAVSLRALQDRLIRDRDYYWFWDQGYPGVESRPWPGTVEELWNSEDFWASGSSTVLDIQRAVDTTRPPSDFEPGDFATVQPLSPDRLRRLFGTEKPAPAQFETLASDRDHPGYEAFWSGERMRWAGRYVLLFRADDEVPSAIGFWGDSGD